MCCHVILHFVSDIFLFDLTFRVLDNDFYSDFDVILETSPPNLELILKFKSPYKLVIVVILCISSLNKKKRCSLLFIKTGNNTTAMLRKKIENYRATVNT